MPYDKGIFGRYSTVSGGVRQVRVFADEPPNLLGIDQGIAREPCAVLGCYVFPADLTVTSGLSLLPSFRGSNSREG